MAGNIVLTPQEGAGSALTLHGNMQAAIDVGKNIVWKTMAVRRASPWEIVEYTGHSTIDAKFMGGKTRSFSIRGYVFDANGDETNLLTAMNSVLALNSVQERYTVSGPITHATNKGVVVTDIVSDPYGDGTGSHWEFVINLRDLGI